jgi:hypothetical protein
LEPYGFLLITTLRVPSDCNPSGFHLITTLRLAFAMFPAASTLVVRQGDARDLIHASA